ncbi:glutamate racemase [Ferrimonas senticii]|uniref:glutamate racemase n=1 Tax=Ferrimonas senticii TaxID=394566 RepID=UPI000401B25B|nr:glutamate racemase [Ferrimonas senticii]
MSSILLFDSGVGGLSVQQHIAAVLPQACLHYLADNGRFPYGELPEQELIDGCVSLIEAFVAQHPIDLVVVACNSASTLVLAPLRQRLSIPVVGVVPAVKPAAQISRTKTIALLATPGTVRRSYTDNLINDFAADCQVLRLGSSELVMMAEAKLSGAPVDMARLSRVLAPLQQPQVDTVILGCTHFPLLTDEIAEVMGPKVQLVDSGAAIARRVLALLANNSAKNNQAAGFYFTGAEPNTSLITALARFGFNSVQRFCA